MIIINSATQSNGNIADSGTVSHKTSQSFPNKKYKKTTAISTDWIPISEFKKGECDENQDKKVHMTKKDINTSNPVRED